MARTNSPSAARPCLGRYSHPRLLVLHGAAVANGTYRRGRPRATLGNARWCTCLGCGHTHGFARHASLRCAGAGARDRVVPVRCCFLWRPRRTAGAASTLRRSAHRAATRSSGARESLPALLLTPLRRRSASAPRQHDPGSHRRGSVLRRRPRAFRGDRILAKTLMRRPRPRHIRHGRHGIIVGAKGIGNRPGQKG